MDTSAQWFAVTFETTTGRVVKAKVKARFAGQMILGAARAHFTAQHGLRHFLKMGGTIAVYREGFGEDFTLDTTVQFAQS